MENRKAEFLKTVCQVYMVSVLAVLPLYYVPWNGYYKLGDSKYYLYRNISLVCLGLCLAVVVIDAIGTRFTVNRSNRQRKDANSQNIKRDWRGIIRNLSGKCRQHSVTTAVCTYSICAILSAICSPYGSVAWLGEREWYMGAVTICLMAGGFLLAANHGEQCRKILLLGEAAFAAVTVIGLFQKLGYDPLGLLNGYIVGDWEYTHMLSTLGNNNWLSGYYSAMFPLSLALFQETIPNRRLLPKAALGICNTLAVMLLLLQGSDGGVIVAGISLWLWLWLNRNDYKNWEQMLLLFAAIAVGMSIFGKMVQHVGTYDILLQDGIAKKMAVWGGWLPAAGVVLLVCVICRLTSDKMRKMSQKGIIYGSLTIAIMTILWYVYHLAGYDFTEWGNRRGMLWQMAWRGFLEGDFHQKLLGAGPDCFASYLAEILPGGTVLFDKGYFAGAVFTNAHNEWLTTLINMGILGVGAYLAVFITAFRRYRDDSFAVMLLLTYGAYSLISFQQVLNTPIFFLLLGICEAASREHKRVCEIVPKQSEKSR